MTRPESRPTSISISYAISTASSRRILISRSFSHLAFYNRELHQIEMHLKSEVAQEVTIAALDLTVPFPSG